MKPVSGGSPARDRSIRGAREVITGVFAQEAARALMFVALLRLKVRNVESVIIR